jgi:hypothetical protein
MAIGRINDTLFIPGGQLTFFLFGAATAQPRR